ncbi:MAG: hypothetical protein MPJ22_00725 [Pirellulales bacterium]|nr:hypothetical protein [Pirellulales bacterium]MDA8040933.1 hypothetical protein [Pirellulales bacterium]
MTARDHGARRRAAERAISDYIKPMCPGFAEVTICPGRTIYLSTVSKPDQRVIERLEMNGVGFDIWTEARAIEGETGVIPAVWYAVITRLPPWVSKEAWT